MYTTQVKNYKPHAKKTVEGQGTTSIKTGGQIRCSGKGQHFLLHIWHLS